ncbi:hypothetical protein HDU76_004153, partial [Blyttiomyces sp. JEL0837]
MGATSTAVAVTKSNFTIIALGVCVIFLISHILYQNAKLADSITSNAAAVVSQNIDDKNNNNNQNSNKFKPSSSNAKENDHDHSGSGSGTSFKGLIKSGSELWSSIVKPSSGSKKPSSSSSSPASSTVNDLLVIDETEFDTLPKGDDWSKIFLEKAKKETEAGKVSTLSCDLSVLELPMHIALVRSDDASYKAALHPPGTDNYVADTMRQGSPFELKYHPMLRRAFKLAAAHAGNADDDKLLILDAGGNIGSHSL